LAEGKLILTVDSGTHEPGILSGKTGQPSPAQGPLFNFYFITAVNIILAFVTLAYMARGYGFLLHGSRGAGDLHLRWVEIQYVLAGRNPFDSYFADPSNGFKPVPLWSHRDPSPLPALGPAKGVAYPPWSYLSSIVLYWPKWPAARVYFAIINTAALALTFWWAFSIGLKYGRTAGMLFGLSFLAMGANCTTLGQGQYGLVIDAYLILALITQGRERGLPEGISMGLAFTKPNVSGLFVLPMIIHRRWSAFFWMLGYILVASAAVSAMTKTSTVEMGLQWLRATRGYGTENDIVFDQLIARGVKMSDAALLVAAVGGLAGLAVIYLWRNASSLLQFAIATTAGRFWSYHRNYDNVMMVFLLVALASAAYQTRKSWLMIVFLLIGTELWLPIRVYDHAVCNYVQQLSWLAGLVILLIATPRHRPTPMSGSPDTRGINPAN
jgi:glycosyl transferase family 87